MFTTRKIHYCILFGILILSGYVHLWNPIGFPDIFFDEGIYMRRAMNILENGTPQEGYLYDHPYFGQLVLSGFLAISGFPETVENSVELSYLIPRILMGLFAILDTFLIYKIAEKQFNKKTAILASVFFAVMPMTWLLRRILLDTILLPFLLSSILLALHSKNLKYQNFMIFGSSVLLGLAIFTKITAVTMIPIVGYIILRQTRFQFLLIWFSGVFTIPMIWPGVAFYLGHLDLWVRDIFWQANRASGQFLLITEYIFSIDPFTTTLGFVAFSYALFKKNLFLLIWFTPFLIFVNFVGFFQYFHYILLIPVISISIGYLLQNNINSIKSIKIQKIIFIKIVLGFAAYGTIILTLLITTDVTSSQFLALEFIINDFDDQNTTLLASPIYTWILDDIYNKRHVSLDYSDIIYYDIKTKYIYLVVDPHYILDQKRDQKLVNIFHGTTKIKEFNINFEEFNTNIFPYQNLQFVKEGEFIHIRTNKTLDIIQNNISNKFKIP